MDTQVGAHGVSLSGPDDALSKVTVLLASSKILDENGVHMGRPMRRLDQMPHENMVQFSAPRRGWKDRSAHLTIEQPGIDHLLGNLWPSPNIIQGGQFCVEIIGPLGLAKQSPGPGCGQEFLKYRGYGRRM